MPIERDSLRTMPLAWTENGDGLLVPEGVTGWKVRQFAGTPGRPPVVTFDNEATHTSGARDR